MLTTLLLGGLFAGLLLALYLLAVLLADPLPPDTFDVEYDPRDFPCDTH